jgi:MFS superfamily sulfate permease-like transporter
MNALRLLLGDADLASAALVGCSLLGLLLMRNHLRHVPMILILFLVGLLANAFMGLPTLRSLAAAHTPDLNL